MNDTAKLAVITARSKCDAEDMIHAVYVIISRAATEFGGHGRLRIYLTLITQF